MAKLLHTTASIAVTLISLSLIVVVAMSFVPLAMDGGMSFEENTPFSMEMDETTGKAIIKGSYDIVSGLPYDITDINASVTIDDGDGGGLEIFHKGPLTIVGNGRSTLDVYSEIFVPSVLISVLAANAGSEDDGLRLPLTIEAGGAYLERMIVLKVSAKVNIVISDVEIPPFTLGFWDEAGNPTTSLEDVAKIDVGISDIPGGDFMDDIPDNATVTIPVGTENVTVSLNKTGPDSNGNYSVSVVIESSDGTLLDALDQLVEAGEPVEVDIDGEKVVLDPESVALLADSLKAALEALMP